MSATALLIEDNQSHIELITDELEAALPDWTIDVASTLADARQRVAQCSYDLVLLDFRLPDGDGMEMLRELRAQGVTMPVIFVTTASSTKLAVEAMKLGAEDYLVKEEGYLTVLPYLIGEVLRRRQLADERQTLEDRLHRAEKAATLGYLASGLAHHINNPLATIRTFLQLLPTHFDDPEFRTRYLEMALAESERIRDLVKEIMRATTVPAETREVSDLGAIIQRARDAVSSTIETKRLNWRENVPAMLPPVRAHSEAATCLLVSLMQNAARFSPDGGTVDVSARCEPDSHHVVVTVKDEGPGIPREHRDKIFEPFFTTAVDGLGMGLFVASRIADLQDIQLTLDGSTGTGATFHVAIPRADEVQPERAEQRVAQVTGTA